MLPILLAVLVVLVLVRLLDQPKELTFTDAEISAAVNEFYSMLDDAFDGEVITDEEEQELAQDAWSTRCL